MSSSKSSTGPSVDKIILDIRDRIEKEYLFFTLHNYGYAVLVFMPKDGELVDIQIANPVKASLPYGYPDAPYYDGSLQYGYPFLSSLDAVKEQHPFIPGADPEEKPFGGVFDRYPNLEAGLLDDSPELETLQFGDIRESFQEVKEGDSFEIKPWDIIHGKVFKVPLENGIRVDRFGSDFPKMTAAYTPLAFQAQEISEELAEAIASGTYWQFAESPGLPVRDIKRVAKWDGEGRCFYLETGAPFFELSLHSEGQYVIEDYVKGICRLHGVKVANEDGGFSFEAAEIKDVKFVQLKYVVTTLGGRLYYPIHAIVRA